MMELSFYVQLKEHIGCFFKNRYYFDSHGSPPKIMSRIILLKEINCVLSEYQIQASDSSFAAYCLFNIYSMKTIKVDFKSAVLHLFYF